VQHRGVREVAQCTGGGAAGLGVVDEPRQSGGVVDREGRVAQFDDAGGWVPEARGAAVAHGSDLVAVPELAERGAVAVEPGDQLAWLRVVELGPDLGSQVRDDPSP
jgi:hypothetical protein